MKRLRIVALGSLAALTSLASVAMGGVARPVPPFEIVTVSPTVVAFVATEPGLGNSVALIGERFVTLVDAPLPAHTGEIFEALAGITDHPVRTLVDTHWHDDHLWGNQVVRDAYPEVGIVAHPATREDILQRAVPALAGNLGRLRETVAARQRILATGREHGESIDAERRAARSCSRGSAA